MSRKQHHDEYLAALTEAGFAGVDAERILRTRTAAKNLQPGQVRVEKSTSESETSVYLYDIIGFDWFGDGMTAKKLNDQLKEAGDVSRINVYINSPGGDAFDGIAMHTILKRQKAKVVVSVDALAASAATLVAMAADAGELRIAASGMIMIHRASCGVWGNTKDMADAADLLDKLDGQIAGMYAARSGRKADTFLKFMDEESWFTGEEAVTEKLADVVTSAKKAAALWMPTALADYRNAPKDAASRFAEPNHRPPSEQLAARLKAVEAA